MPEPNNCPPAPGDLWLSRLDDDGAVLNEVREGLDASWWQNFHPLVRRFG